MMREMTNDEYEENCAQCPMETWCHENNKLCDYMIQKLEGETENEQGNSNDRKNSDGGRGIRMIEQCYLFVFEDDTTYEMSCGISIKDAVYEMAKYTGNVSEMFRKSLFSDEFIDVDDIVHLFNHWCHYSPIKAVYVVKKKLYPAEEKI